MKKKESIEKKWNTYNLNNWNYVKILEDVKSLYNSILSDYSVDEFIDFLSNKLHSESYDINDQFISTFLLKMHNNGYINKEKIESHIANFKFSCLEEDETKVVVRCKFSNLLKIYELVKDYANFLKNQNNVASEYNANKTLEMFYFQAIENNDKFECFEKLKECYIYEIFNKNVNRKNMPDQIKFEINERVLKNSFFMSIYNILKQNNIGNMIFVNYNEEKKSVALSYEFDIKDKKYAEVLNDILSSFPIEENYILEALMDSKIKKFQMKEDNKNLNIEKNKSSKIIKF